MCNPLPFLFLSQPYLGTIQSMDSERSVPFVLFSSLTPFYKAICIDMLLFSPYDSACREKSANEEVILRLLKKRLLIVGKA
jgi:hypothetical protein